MSLRVFLSWSGDRSHSLARELYDWVPKVIQAAKPWMSEVDVPAGGTWSGAVGENLARHDVGILCLTPENVCAPWLIFEAGALSKAMGRARVCPVLLGLEPRDLEGGPLAQFQATRCERESMLKLVKDLNDLQQEEKVPEQVLAHAFERSWPDLEAVTETLAGAGQGPPADDDEIVRFVRGDITVKRRQDELAENNRYLQAGTSLKVVAMTYKSLSAALPGLSFQRLQEAELCTYALPNLLFTHPVLHRGLEVEWYKGVSTTIKGLLDETRCPELTHLDLVLLSVTPGLTGTSVAWSDPERGREGDRLRMTFIIDGSQPEDIPTLVASRRSDRKEDGPIFEAFQTMIDQVGRRTSSALRFVLKRPNYTRSDVERFTRHLQKVSNHPKVGPRDRTFRLSVDLDRRPSDGGRLSPFDVARALRDGGGAAAFRARWDRPDDRLTLVRDGGRPSEATAVRGDHLFACFALMTRGDDLVLVEHKKGGWECDVPGGKVSSIDGTEQDALVREVFEELGLLLTAERLSAPIGWKYDPKSAREAHKPVIAQYYHYPLTRDEITYLFEVACETTKGSPLVRFPLSRLLQEKRTSDSVIEAVCHAPLWAVEGLTRMLESDR